MVADTRPPPDQGERTVGSPPHRSPTEPPPKLTRVRNAEACAIGEHDWQRWVEQSFDSLEREGPIAFCRHCGERRP